MISIPSVPAVAGGYPPQLPVVSAAGSDGAQLREVAQGFEAMLLRQVLSAAGKTDFGGEDIFGSSSDKTFTEMRDARFADLAAAQGSLGLAAQIEAQLARQTGGTGTEAVDPALPPLILSLSKDAAPTPAEAQGPSTGSGRADVGNNSDTRFGVND